MDCLNRLTDNGYKHFDTDKSEFDNGFNAVEHKLGKRVDTLSEYVGCTLCKLNDKVFINISVGEYSISGDVRPSWNISVCHESKVGWVDLSIYGLSIDELENLSYYEHKIMKLWEAAND